jgi:hypothetical protein
MKRWQAWIQRLFYFMPMDIENFALTAFRSEGFLSVSKTLIEKLGVKKALVLSNYLDKHVYWKNKSNFDDWFYLRYKDQINQFGGDFGEDTLRKYRDYFIDEKILLLKKKGNPAKTYYKIDFEQLIIAIYGQLPYPKNSGTCSRKILGTTPKNSGTINIIRKTEKGKQKIYKKSLNNKFCRLIKIVDLTEKLLQETNTKLEFKNTINEWFEYKQDRKESYKNNKSKTMFIKKLVKLSNNDPHTAQEIIEESMASNYAGIFPPKNKPKQKQPTPSTKNYWNQENNYGKKKTVLGKYGKVIKK